jgi:hypothetical protein
MACQDIPTIKTMRSALAQREGAPDDIVVPAPRYGVVRLDLSLPKQPTPGNCVMADTSPLRRWMIEDMKLRNPSIGNTVSPFDRLKLQNPSYRIGCSTS